MDVRIKRSNPACCSPEGDSSRRRYPDIEEGARLFKALADETRLAILKQLKEQGEVCACEFVACCELAQPTVSHHLKVLKEAGLVRGERRGLWVYFTLDEAAMGRLRALLP